MRSILEELYFGNFHMNSGFNAKDPTYVEAVQLKDINYEKLMATLNGSEKEWFEKFLEADEDLKGIENYYTFTRAFKLGVLLMTEVFTNTGQATGENEIK